MQQARRCVGGAGPPCSVVEFGSASVAAAWGARRLRVGGGCGHETGGGRAQDGAARGAHGASPSWMMGKDMTAEDRQPCRRGSNTAVPTRSNTCVAGKVASMTTAPAASPKEYPTTRAVR